MTNAWHTPLFLTEISELLVKRGAKKVIDATFAEGGHGISLAKRGIEVLGIEWDEEMYEVGMENIRETKLSNCHLVKGNYREVLKLADDAGFRSADAIIFDLGLSMYQLRHSQKGFSLNREALIDLRIGSNLKLPGYEFLNKAPKTELISELEGLLEDRLASKVIERVDSFRHHRPLQTVEDLRLALAPLKLNDQQTNRLLRKLLQALRIIVNDEFENIRSAFWGGIEILAPNGLLIFLTYHSLEDRLVKRLGVEARKQLRAVQKIKSNKDYKFATSGKLRVYEKYLA
jgi:16S rRNA (cytosine1402-N4)-methyltransferase